jgi:glutaredoxin
MDRVFPAQAALAGLALLALATAASAQDRQVYRYVDPDGRVVYTDRPPPSGAKDLQTKRVGGNFIENTESVATQMAAERFPVTLYTFACGDVCQNAEALLNRRGVPFATVNVQEKEGGERLQNLTGEMNAPVLQVGDKLLAKGYNEASWSALLDQAGYPKSPPSRRGTPTRPPADTATAARAAAASGTGAPR